MKVAILTTAIPTRLDMLVETMASVRAQTVQPYRHLIGFDYPMEGNPTPVINPLARAAASMGCDFLVPLADDDILEPDFLKEVVAAQEASGADIVYPWCRVEGGNWNPNQPFNADKLRRFNFIPATALIRMSLWLDLGGYDQSQWAEDHDLWVRALDKGATFHCVERPLWIYRANHSPDQRRLVQA